MNLYAYICTVQLQGTAAKNSCKVHAGYSIDFIASQCVSHEMQSMASKLNYAYKLLKYYARFDETSLVS